MSQHDFAMSKAKQIIGAIENKIGEVKGYSRLIETNEFSYIELGFTPKGKSVLDEVQVAYSASYFDEMKTAEILKARAARICKDAQIALGLETEPA